MDKVVQSPSFVHLRVHSEFSVVDGILRISDLIERSVAQGQPAVALTDLSNVFGLIKFIRQRGAQVSSRLPVAMFVSPTTKTAKNPTVSCC